MPAVTVARNAVSRRPSTLPVARPVVAPPPPVRLRHVLGVALLGLAVWGALPRARAAWELPSAATALADYALCMVGPTGPGLLRDNPTAFRDLSRLRLVTSGADDVPFSRCARRALELTGDGRVERAHQAPASRFVEWGGARSADSLTLADVAVSTRRLAELAEAAWPLVRGGYTSQVRPSAYAAEAPHPAALPTPGLSRGMPPERAILSGGRCETGAGGAFVLGFSADRRERVARSVTPEGPTHDAPFAPSGTRVLTASCDERALTIAVAGAGAEVALRSCTYLGACAQVPLPRLAKDGPPLAAPFDLARSGGAIIVAKRMGGIVRVASTRDDGRSWTPFVVAFDEASARPLRAGIAVPDRLTVVGRRVLLHGAPDRPTATYPVLASDDHGASWRAP